MSNALVHRGPDGEGFWRSSGTGPGVVLAHRRLAIIDLREIANQPMLDQSNGNRIVFNGEIYNYRELRDSLRSAGHQFETEGDTEVLLKAYAEWGRDCLHRLRGMFAFAIWDARQAQLFLARDRMGIKPLYYSGISHAGRRSFWFASELRALLASNRIPRVLDQHAVHSYLWHGFVPGPRTIVRDISQLSPGSALVVDSRGEIVERYNYWQAPLNTVDGDDVTEAARETLSDAIRLRMRSDVPVATFLSGGVDSSVVTYGAFQASGHNLQTFTVGFAEQSYDETAYSSSFADELGVVNTIALIEQQDFSGILPDALAAMDQPTHDGINSYLISRAVSEQGIKVALSGTGGDELFGGYSSFRNLYDSRKLGHVTGLLPAGLMKRLAVLLNRFRDPEGCQLREFLDANKKIERLLTGKDTVLGYQSIYSVISGSLLKQLHQFDPGESMAWGLDADHLAGLQRQASGYPVASVTGWMEQQSFLAERVLRDADWASMAVSLELRVPIIDHELVEILGRFPSEMRYQPFSSKAKLKEIGLPDSHWPRFDRPKSGFTIPIAEWIHGALAENVVETLLDGKLALDIGLSPSVLEQLVSHNTYHNRHLMRTRIWALYALMNWCRLHQVKVG